MEIIDLIEKALNCVPQEYYRLRTTYSKVGIVRERVFCYELYHKMRCLQEDEGLTGIHLHGEIDKRGHELFDKDDWKIPISCSTHLPQWRKMTL